MRDQPNGAANGIHKPMASDTTANTTLSAPPEPFFFVSDIILSLRNHVACDRAAGYWHDTAPQHRALLLSILVMRLTTPDAMEACLAAQARVRLVDCGAHWSTAEIMTERPKAGSSRYGCHGRRRSLDLAFHINFLADIVIGDMVFVREVIAEHRDEHGDGRGSEESEIEEAKREASARRKRDREMASV